MRHLHVFKFGGSGLRDATDLVQAADVVSSAKEAGPVVVATAMDKVEHDLRKACVLASERASDKAHAMLDRVRNKYFHEGSVILSEERADHLSGLFDEATDLVKGMSLLSDSSQRVVDRVVACGHRAAAVLISSALEKAGLQPVTVDASEFIDTDGRFGRAAPLPFVADRHSRAKIIPLLEQGLIPVVPGSMGRANDGATVTFGKAGGSLTACFLAAALGAEKVVLWSDTPGIYSADPVMVPGATIIEHLHFREAAELSYFGLSSLHPRSLVPVASSEVEVEVRSLSERQGSLTRIDSSFQESGRNVKAVQALTNHALLSVEGKGMAGMAGIAAKVFSALAQRTVSVTMISQSSSESSICIAVPTNDAKTAETALRKELDREIFMGDVDDVVVVPDVSLLAVIGMGMMRVPGTAARVFGSVAEAGVNVMAMAQGPAELSISLAVEHGDHARAVEALALEFGLAKGLEVGP